MQLGSSTRSEHDAKTTRRHTTCTVAADESKSGGARANKPGTPPDWSGPMEAMRRRSLNRHVATLEGDATDTFEPSPWSTALSPPAPDTIAGTQHRRWDGERNVSPERERAKRRCAGEHAKRVERPRFAGCEPGCEPGQLGGTRQRLKSGKDAV